MSVRGFAVMLLGLAALLSVRALSARLRPDSVSRSRTSLRRC